MQQWNDTALMLPPSSVCRVEKTAPGNSANDTKTQQLSSKTNETTNVPFCLPHSKNTDFYFLLFSRCDVSSTHILTVVLFWWALSTIIFRWHAHWCSTLKKKVTNKGKRWNSGPAVIFLLCCQCEKFRNRMWPTVAPNTTLTCYF